MSSLRVIVLLPEKGIRNWEIDCLNEIKESQAEIVGVIKPKNPDLNITQIFLSYIKRGIKKVLRFLFLPQKMFENDVPSWVKELPLLKVETKKKGLKEYFKSETIDWIKQKNPDMILRFGFGIIGGSILQIAPQGVWSFHHGDLEEYRGRPPVFWELYNDVNRVGVTLQRLDEKLDAGKVLIKGFVPAKNWSLKKTLARSYEQSPLLLRKAVNKYIDGTLEETKPDKLGNLYKSPTIFNWFIFIIKMVKNYFQWLIEKSFHKYDWKVGLEDKDLNLEGDNFVCPSWIESPSEGFYADPVFIPGNNQEILVEHWSRRERKGLIKKIDLHNEKATDFLKEKYHLSFPKIYEVNNNFWLVPEMGEHNKQYAFLMPKDANSDMSLKRNVIKGIHGVDPIFLDHNDKWWCFISPNDKQSCYHLNLFHSENFLGPYIPHSLNPIVVDPHGARMAGYIYDNRENIFRFGQIFNKRYGEGIDIFRIEKLTDTNYKETRVGSIRLESDIIKNGIHSIELSRNQILVDGYTMQKDILAGVYRILDHGTN